MSLTKSCPYSPTAEATDLKSEQSQFESGYGYLPMAINNKGVETMEENTRLSPPWVTYVNEIRALFGNDPEIKIEFNEDTLELKLFVENQIKADAIAKILPTEKEFGNVVVKIAVIPADDESETALFKNAFFGNPVVAYVQEAERVPGAKKTFVVFNRQIVQFWNDDLSDLYGNKTTLCQEIAKEVFPDSDVSFCTDNK